MKLYAPEYYRQFACIADRCRHSCCRLWDIGVDEDTITLARSGGDILLDELLARTRECEDGYYIEKCDGGACPFLDECGLCRLILAKGDEYLPRICREHPRFYNHVGDRIEVGLGLACEEAARLVLSTDGFDKTVEVGEIDGEVEVTPYGYKTRDGILERLASLPSYNCFVSEVVEKFNLSAIEEEQSGIADLFTNLEYLDSDEGALISSAASELAKVENEYQRRFFAYLIYRYLTVAESESEARSAIGLAVVLTNIFTVIYNRLGGGLNSAVESARILSSEIEYSPDNVNEILFEIDYLLV